MIITSFLRFEKLQQIGNGQGANSQVWLARDKQLDCELVIKEITKTGHWNNNFFQEAQTVYAVEHPNVVRINYATEDLDRVYLGMPFYPTGSLADRLAAGPLKLSSVLKIGLEILHGLAFVHSKGFLHLDLKPTNIFFDSYDRALIADFGQSEFIGDKVAVDAPPVYNRTIPPEVINSGNAAVVSDIYQVGLLLYRALNGEAIWNKQLANYTSAEDLDAAITDGRFPDRQVFLPHVPKRLRTILRKAMSVEPTSRFPDATTFATELGKVELSHDWSVQLTSGEMAWRCTPTSTAPLLIMLRHQDGSWRIECFTEKNGSPRAKGKADLWQNHPTQKSALIALKTIFELF